jgi:hypothetical protein
MLAQHRFFIRLQRICMHDAQTPFAPRHKRFEQRQETRVLLDRDYMSASLQQRPGEAARAWADFDHVLVLQIARRLRDAAGDVHVEEEVLTERLVGPEAVRLQFFAQLW